MSESDHTTSASESPASGRRVGALTPSAWLDLWEEGQGLTSAQRALLWLQAARLHDDDDPALWPIGERDRQILLLRESSFGLALEGIATCPDCRERLELRLTTRDILAANPVTPVTASSITITVGGRDVRFRLPVAGDLATLSAGTAEAARDQLLAACFLGGEEGEAAVAFHDIPPHVHAVVEADMAASDPDATIDLALTCPACRYAWTQPFDPPSFLASELDAWARRTLNEIHALASAYGWTEAEILGLSPARRQLYVSFVAP